MDRIFRRNACKWLISGGVAEISQYGSSNFFPRWEFKYIGASDRKKIQKTCRFGGFSGWGPDLEQGGTMKYMKYLALVAVLMVPLAYSQAQVAVGIGVEPVCGYGYYNYYPYACAPYGYYGPSWFVGGLFIGAGPWYGWHGGWGAG